MDPKFPHVSVDLAEVDGNAFSVLGEVRKAMKAGGCSRQDMDEFFAEAISGDYDHLLQTVMATVSTD